LIEAVIHGILTGMYSIIFITASGKNEARKIAAGLLKKKLIACANIIDGVESHFWWQGKIDSGKEALLIIKSRKSKVKDIIETARSLHSYDTPEIIAVPITAGEKKYLRWIDGSLR